MSSSDNPDSEIIRIRLLILFKMAVLAGLAMFLWSLQVMDNSKYQKSSSKQSLRRVRIPGERGRIYDRNGLCLADNRPSYCMAIYVHELREPGNIRNTIDEVEKTVARLSGILGLKQELTRKDIVNHMRKRLPLPLIAWKDIDSKAMARWAESQTRLPGVDLYIEPVRVYPLREKATQILGYVTRRSDPNMENDSEDYDYYIPEMDGNSGIEKIMDYVLTGYAGGKLIMVDASGFRFDDLPEREPLRGENVTLAIDSGIQSILAEAMEGERGAAVVVDPRNGDILALHSAPSFDPNMFMPSISKEDLLKLTKDPDKPLINRAIQGAYPPGSIFKPIVSLAALKSGLATEGTGYACPGYYMLGNVRFDCWQKSGHGWIEMPKAIEQSCNSYFCQLGIKCGPDNIRSMARDLGLGVKTGIPLLYEERGNVPDRQGWRGGDTCNFSIGQGALLVTPLQMGMYAAALANGGTLYKPTLIRSQMQGGHEIVRKLEMNPRHIRTVREGMRDVIESSTGTGKRAKVAGVQMAGKTGTAEYGKKSDRKKHTWMIVFGPYEAPRYAVAMIVEDGMSGGMTVAPRMKKLMDGVFTLDGTIKPAALVPQAGGA